MKATLLAFWTSWLFVAPPCQAWMSTKIENHVVTITGNCKSLEEQPSVYRYELLVARRGPSGRSANTQQGRFELQPGQGVTLSQVQISVDEHTSYAGRLRILDATGQVVAQDSVTHLATQP